MKKYVIEAEVGELGINLLRAIADTLHGDGYDKVELTPVDGPKEMGLYWRFETDMPVEKPTIDELKRIPDVIDVYTDDEFQIRLNPHKTI